MLELIRDADNIITLERAETKNEFKLNQIQKQIIENWYFSSSKESKKSFKEYFSTEVYMSGKTINYIIKRRDKELSYRFHITEYIDEYVKFLIKNDSIQK